MTAADLIVLYYLCCAVLAVAAGLKLTQYVGDGRGGVRFEPPVGDGE